MGIIDGIRNFLGLDKALDGTDYSFGSQESNFYIKEIAINKSINLIANSIAKCDIEVFRKNSNGKIKSQKDKVFYKLNVRPNHNIEGTTFWKKVVKKLIVENEALIIFYRGNIYLADSFNYTDAVLYPKKYTSIQIESITLPPLPNHDVIHLKLDNPKTRTMLNNFFVQYNDLIVAGKSSFLSKNSNKWGLKLPTGQPRVRTFEDGKEKDLPINEYKKQLSEGLTSAGDSVITMGTQTQFELLNSKNTSSKNADTEMMKTLFNDAFDMVAKAMDIPLDIFHGNKTEKSQSNDDFISQCCDPIISVIEDGINAKWFTEQEFLDGECVKINKQQITHTNILNFASNLDKLFAIGFNHNELKRIASMPEVDEEWARKRYITKNYGSVDEIVDKNKKGGD